MGPDIGGAAAAVGVARRRLTPLIPGASVTRKDGAVAMITGLPSSAFNGPGSPLSEA